MKHTYTLLVILSLAYLSGSAQGIWTATSARDVWDRYDDIYFIDADTGWAVTLDYDITTQMGWIFKTTDGGVTWDSMNAPITSEYRDIAFLDGQTGFVGTLQTSWYNMYDTAIMYTTTDGGSRWNPVSNLPGPRPAGICGMRVINDFTLYACGRFFGPAGFYKTTNKGASWTYVSLDSLAGGLVDAYFFGPDTGFIVGSSDTNFLGGRGVILYTTNGGEHWARMRISDTDSEMCWKMSFPSRSVGYASIESFRSVADSQFCMKTTDGGLTWHEVYFCTGSGYNGNLYGFDFDAQAIGFINDTVGWIGGRDTSAAGIEYKTTDGGNTWTAEHWGKNLNRFRWTDDGIGYVSGTTVYRYCPGIPLYDTAVICPDQAYVIGGQAFNQTGNYSVNTFDPCNTIVNLALMVYPWQTPDITDSAGVLYTGPFLSYHWMLNGSDIPGDTLSHMVPSVNGTYSLWAIDSNNCYELSGDFAVSGLGIASVPGTALMFYPDPAYDRLVIAGLPDGSPVVITDIAGQVVITEIYNTSMRPIDISMLPAGIYFLNNKKFVKP